jgi:hypothetical protein
MCVAGVVMMVEPKVANQDKGMFNRSLNFTSGDAC